MVSWIYVTKEKKRDLEPPYATIENYHNDNDNDNKNKFVFDDWTGYFTDLKIWDSQINLHEKTVKEVKNIIIFTLDGVKEKGYTARKMTLEDKEMLGNPNWMHGCTSGYGMYGRDYFELPENERISVLMFHLEDILDTLKECDENNYCHFVY